MAAYSVLWREVTGASHTMTSSQAMQVFFSFFFFLHITCKHLTCRKCGASLLTSMRNGTIAMTPACPPASSSMRDKRIMKIINISNYRTRGINLFVQSFCTTPLQRRKSCSLPHPCILATCLANCFLSLVPFFFPFPTRTPGGQGSPTNEAIFPLFRPDSGHSIPAAALLN